MARRNEHGSKKAKLPLFELEGEIASQTKAWIDEYLLSVPEPKTRKEYQRTLLQFFKYTHFTEKPLDSFTPDDVNTFLISLSKYNYSASRKNTYISVLSELRNYLKKEYPTIFSIEFLYGIENLRTPSDLEASPHFDLITLGKIREVIENNVAWKYIFEVAFQLGIKKNDLNKCLPEYSDRENQAFIYKGEIISYVGTSIQSVIDEYTTSRSPSKISYQNSIYLLKGLEKELKERGIYSNNIDYNTLLATHKAYQFTCPNCGRSSLCIDRNWVLARIDDNPFLFLVCTQCRGAQPNLRASV